jgi:hypothetical protein
MHVGTTALRAQCKSRADRIMAWSGQAERWRAGSDAMGFASVAGFRVVGNAFGGRARRMWGSDAWIGWCAYAGNEARSHVRWGTGFG